MSLFVVLPSCFRKSLIAGFCQHSEWFLSRKVEEIRQPVAETTRCLCQLARCAASKGLNEGLPVLLSEVFVQPFRTASPGASPPRRISIMSYSNIRPAMHLVSRERESHPNHHLTNNNGTWWCQITVHQGLFSRRLRFSLGTGDLERARLLRDRVFDNLSAGPQAA